MEWYHVCWPRLTAKRVEPVVSISWASCWVETWSECLPRSPPFNVLCQTVSRTWGNFVNWTCWKLSHIFSSATLIQKLFWATDEGFENSCVAPRTYLHGIQIWRVSRWPLFLFNHLRTVLVQALLRETWNARRAPCIFVESATPSGTSRLHSSRKLGS